MSFNIPERTPSDTRWNWSGLIDAAIPLALSRFAETQSAPTIVVAPDLHFVNRLQRELRIFASPALPILSFPDCETLPYDRFSPHESITSDRLATLYRLPQLSQGVVIVGISTLLRRLPPGQFIHQQVLVLNKGDNLVESSFVDTLSLSGYRHVDQVTEHGEFCIRGAIIDLFPMGTDAPLRIERFDDTVETLRTFDPETQISTGKIDRIAVLPAHEYPLNETGISHFRNQWRTLFEGNPKSFPIYTSISEGKAIAGAEYYLPLFFEDLSTLFDYLPEQSNIVLLSDAEPCIKNTWEEINRRFQQVSCDPEERYCKAETLYLKQQEFFEKAKSFFQIALSGDKKSTHSFNSQAIPYDCATPEKSNPITVLAHEIRQSSNRWLFCAESSGRREVLLEWFRQENFSPKIFDTWAEFLLSDEPLGLMIAALDAGAILPNLNITVISEADLFGEKIMQRRRRQKRSVDPNVMIRHLAELKVGDAVVHMDHGIGYYRGLTTITTQGSDSEYLTLEYAGEDRIYVPITSLDRITRYTGHQGEHIQLQKLGSSSWEKKKARAREKVFDAAAELLKIYSEREAKKGYALTRRMKTLKNLEVNFPLKKLPTKALQLNPLLLI